MTTAETKRVLEYDWRQQSIATARGGFYAQVEKFWCEPGDDDEGGEEKGWRWSGFNVNGPSGFRSLSLPMSFSAAQAAAENWIQDQIERAKGLAVYAFAGLERPADHIAFERDANGLDVLR